MCVQGPGYWGYGTRYTCYAIASLITALGSDQGLGEFVGFHETADFNVYMQGTSWKDFNWADDKVYSHPTDSAVAFFLAKQYNRPEAAVVQRQKLQVINGSVHDVIDYTPIGTVADLEKLPLYKLYQYRNVFAVRGSWTESNAPFLGFKGGNVSYHHSHMDLGSFVFELHGKRFAIDLGSDNYGLPEYFGKKRFTYYRLRNAGHNTLMFDDDNQGPKAAAAITHVSKSSEGGMAVVNLTDAYAPSNLSSVLRTFEWTFRSDLTHLQMTDEIEYGESQAKVITWAMHTQAGVRNNGKAFLLKQGSEDMTVSWDDMSDCPGMNFTTNAVDLQPPQNPTKGVTRLAITAPASTCKKIIINFSDL